MTGCGGGGGGGGAESATGASSSSAPSSSTFAPNVQPISVELGPAHTVNLAFTSVTLCQPGDAGRCQTIDHVIVDTGSSGLRVLSSAISASLALPQQLGSNGDPIVECAQFADGFSWGPLKIADLRIAGKQANALTIQVIGDPAFSTTPTNCESTGRAKKHGTNPRCQWNIGRRCISTGLRQRLRAERQSGVLLRVPGERLPTGRPAIGATAPQSGCAVRCRQ